jgi:hypothetical protein
MRTLHNTKEHKAKNHFTFYLFLFTRTKISYIHCRIYELFPVASKFLFTTNKYQPLFEVWANLCSTQAVPIAEVAIFLPPVLHTVRDAEELRGCYVPRRNQQRKQVGVIIHLEELYRPAQIGLARVVHKRSQRWLFFAIDVEALPCASNSLFMYTPIKK